MKTGTHADMTRRDILMKASNDAMTIQDLNGNIKAWNGIAVNMYGYTEAEALTMNILQLVPPNIKKESESVLKQIATRGIVTSFETQRLSKYGKILNISIMATCLKNDSGAVDSIATIERDTDEAWNIQRKKQIEAVVLEGLFPACAVCKRIRNDRGSWHQIESYAKRPGEKELMQTLCVQCSEVDYPWIKSHHLNH